MIDTRINKVSAKGNNIFIFQYINEKGESTDVEQSFDEFLKPFVKPLQEQIITLKQSLQDKQKIEGLLDQEVLQLSSKINQLETEKNNLSTQVKHFLTDIDGKDMDKTSDLYKQAFELFTKGQIDQALQVLDDAKLEDEETKAIQKNKQLAQKASIRNWQKPTHKAICHMWQ